MPCHQLGKNRTVAAFLIDPLEAEMYWARLSLCVAFEVLEFSSEVVAGKIQASFAKLCAVQQAGDEHIFPIVVLRLLELLPGAKIDNSLDDKVPMFIRVNLRKVTIPKKSFSELHHEIKIRIKRQEPS